MKNINDTIQELHHMDAVSSSNSFLRKIHPLGKLTVTITYIVILVSFEKYHLSGMLWMAVYLIALFLLDEKPFGTALKRVGVFLWIFFFVGVGNLFFDRQVIWLIGGFSITGGVISMLTLGLKGCFALLASYLLVMSTSIQEICYALRILHMPKELVTIILLMNRYLIVFLKEIARMNMAYRLRAPGQKGIHFRTWGAIVGRLLLKSVDMSKTVYESMKLRGFRGEFVPFRHVYSMRLSWGFSVVWLLVFCSIRLILA